MASEWSAARACVCCNAAMTHAVMCRDALASDVRAAAMHAALSQMAVNALMAEMPGDVVDEVSVELLGPGAPAGEE